MVEIIKLLYLLSKNSYMNLILYETSLIHRLPDVLKNCKSPQVHLSSFKLFSNLFKIPNAKKLCLKKYPTILESGTLILEEQLKTEKALQTEIELLSESNEKNEKIEKELLVLHDFYDSILTFYFNVLNDPISQLCFIKYSPNGYKVFYNIYTQTQSVTTKNLVIRIIRHLIGSQR